MGGGGFLGTGKGKAEQASSQADPEISAFARELGTQSRPTRELVFGQVEEALRTGGIGARIPIIAEAEERSRQATSRALQQTEESLAMAGLAGSPFGERIRAETRLAGEQATRAIGPGVAREFINVAPNLALGAAGTVISGLSSAADVGVRQLAIGTQASIAQLQAFVSMMNAIGGSGSSAGAAAAMCWVAAAVYGFGTPEFFAARRFIVVLWRGRVADATRWLYLRIGPWLGRRPKLCRLFKPLLDVAVRRGR